MTARGDQGAVEATEGSGGLRILHVLRSPVGGLFRHVVDLSRAQASAGHRVGVIADSTTGGDYADRVLAEMPLSLGLVRTPMRRLPHPNDFSVAYSIARHIRSLEPDIVHGHGAKGGLYARLPALLPVFPQPKRPLARVYTPHGGSLHFEPDSVLGRLFFTAERLMERVTDFIPFESDYARRRYAEAVIAPHALSSVVHNGLAETEFAPIEPVADAADFVFVGEMRLCKGVDTLIEAFAKLPGSPRLALVGSGLDESAFRGLAARLRVADRVTFTPPMHGREALRRGKILVAPSRQESLPYVLLEATAARAPVVATKVGGNPEIFGAQAFRLVPPDDPDALAAAMRDLLEMDPAARRAIADEIAGFVHGRFTLEQMTEGVLRGYREALRAARLRPYDDRSAQLPTGD